MRVPEGKWNAPYPILLHVSWVLGVRHWYKRSQTSLVSNPVSTLPRRTKQGLECKILDMAPFFYVVFVSPASIETDGYFFLGVGRAIWLQCLIVIIADSDTLLAGSSLLLRQLPFNRKERGREGEAQPSGSELGSLLGLGWAAEGAGQVSGPHPGTWKGPERFWLSLIKGSQSFAAALFLSRTKLLESALFLILFYFIFFSVFLGRGNLSMEGRFWQLPESI